MMRPLLVIGFLCTALPPASAQDVPGALTEPAAPVIRAADLDRWSERDDEARWVLIARDLTRNPGNGAAWVTFLAAERAHQQLEWLATSQEFGTADALAQLHAVDDPRWIRVALRRRGLVDSHSKEGAATLLKARARTARAWGELYRDALTDDEATFLAGLGDVDSNPQSAAGYAPPYTFDELYGALQRADDAVEFGERVRARDGEVYVHQVERALGHATLAPERGPRLTDALLTVARSENARLGAAACRALVQLPTDEIPDPLLFALAADEERDPKHREAAYLAATYGPAPRVFARLHAHLADPRHPHWRIAVARLAALGDGFTATRLRRLEGLDEGQTVQLDGIRASLTARANAADAQPVLFVQPWLERAAWADLAVDPLAPDLVEWTIRRLQGLLASGKHPELFTALEALVVYRPRDGASDVYAGLASRVQALAERALD